VLNAEKVCTEMVLPKILSKSPQPHSDELIVLTKLCKDILGVNMGHDIDLWIKTKAGKVKTSKEVFLSSDFKPSKNWEIHQEYIPGLSFIDSIYLTGNPSDEELKSWRDFFKASGVKESPDNGVEEFAINYTINKLVNKYRNVQRVDKLNYGFDIQAETFDSVPIHVEVKGVSNEQDVELTGNEVKAADKYKNSFYLSVVSAIPNSPSIYLVNNPASVGKKDKLTITVDTWKPCELT